MSNKDNNTQKLLQVLEKFSGSVIALLQKLGAQKVVSVEMILKALPPKVREQFLKDIAARTPKQKTKPQARGKSR